MHFKNKGRCIVYELDKHPLNHLLQNMYNFTPLLKRKQNNDINLSDGDFKLEVIQTRMTESPYSSCNVYH